MAYNARISANNKQTIIFMIDQSGSMNETVDFNGSQVSKAQAVADVVNEALSEIIARCNNYGDYKSYFNIAVFGYGGYGVKSLLGEGRQNFYNPCELAYSFKSTAEVTVVRSLPNGETITTKQSKKVWIEPVAEGRTPMVGTINFVYDLLYATLAREENKNSFPPLVFNITDGEVNDGDLNEMVVVGGKLKSLSTNDGDVILMNVHIANRKCEGLIFPSSERICPLECTFGSALFEMASVMPQFFESEIEQIVDTQKPYKAFAYNASIADLVRMINIGSSSTTLIL